MRVGVPAVFCVDSDSEQTAIIVLGPVMYFTQFHLPFYLDILIRRMGVASLDIELTSCCKSITDFVFMVLRKTSNMTQTLMNGF